MAENEATAVKVSSSTASDVKHTMKGARLLYSAPRFILRGPIYMIFVIGVGGLMYSFYSKVDQVVNCKMVLTTNIAKVQSPSTGVVNDIFVGENDNVKLGSSLVDIQFKTGALMDSEADSLQQQIDKLSDEKKRLMDSKETEAEKIEDIKKTIETETTHLTTLEDEFKQQDETFKDQIDAAKAKETPLLEQIKIAQGDVVNAENQLKAKKVAEEDALKQMDDEQKLVNQKLSTIDRLQALKTVHDNTVSAYQIAQTSVGQANGKVAQLNASLAEIRAEPARLAVVHSGAKLERDKKRADSRSLISQMKNQIEEMKKGSGHNIERMDSEIKRLEDKKEQTKKILPNVKYEGELCKVSSSFPGKIISVFIKPGEQIARGQAMFGVWKEDTEPIYASIMVENKDIARIHLDQEVHLKYYAYPYQEYGSKFGKITNIPLQTSDVKGQETMYEVQVQLMNSKDKIMEDKGQKKIKPSLGLQGLAEIVVGQKLLIETVFSPISKFLSADD